MTSSRKIPTSEEFSEAIKQFLHENKTDLDSFMQRNGTREQKLAEQFYSHPVIHRYLTRKAHDVVFEENYPQLDNPQEMRIYKLDKALFLFRRNAAHAQFYLAGTNLSIPYPNLFLILQKKYGSKDVVILQCKDVYDIGDQLAFYIGKSSSLKKNLIGQNPRFILTPCYTDGHSNMMCHIFEPYTRRGLVSILIDSVTPNLEHLMPRLNQGITSRFIPPIKMLADSHLLQVKKEDQNCALYAFNFMVAIAQMLRDSAVAERVFQHACAFDQEDQRALSGLQAVFQQELKAFLPCYYDCNRNPRSYAELKKFHLAQRWDLDSELLTLAHPLCEEAKAEATSFQSYAGSPLSMFPAPPKAPHKGEPEPQHTVRCDVWYV